MNPPIPWSASLDWRLGFNVSAAGPGLNAFPDGAYQAFQAREFSLRGYAEWRAENAKVEAARILTYLHTNKSGHKELNQFVPEYMRHDHYMNNKSFMIDSLLSRQDAEDKITSERGFPPDSQHRHGLNLSTAKNASSASKQPKADSISGKDNVHVYIKGCRPHPYTQKICPNHSHARNSLVFQNKLTNSPASDSGPAQNTASSTPVPIEESVSGEKYRDASPQATRRPAKAKRVRTIFTPEQLEKLEAEFERQQYMVGPERLYLASSLSLSEAQVKVWFQNRRIKWRKQHLELQQQRLAALRSQQEDLELEESTDYGDSNSPTPTAASPSLPEFSPQAVQRAHSTPLPHHLSPLTKAYFYVTSPDDKSSDRERENDGDRDNSQPCSPTSTKVPGSPKENGF